ncbi:MAG: hypothetical protein RSF79_28345, partial [Janthinobacterium sp.]
RTQGGCCAWAQCGEKRMGWARRCRPPVNALISSGNMPSRRKKALLISRGTGFSAAKSHFCKQGWQCVKVWIAS